jgi:hypothetical protein
MGYTSACDSACFAARAHELPRARLCGEGRADTCVLDAGADNGQCDGRVLRVVHYDAGALPCELMPALDVPSCIPSTLE